MTYLFDVGGNVPGIHFLTGSVDVFCVDVETR